MFIAWIFWSSEASSVLTELSFSVTSMGQPGEVRTDVIRHRSGNSPIKSSKPAKVKIESCCRHSHIKPNVLDKMAQTKEAVNSDDFLR